VHVICGVVAERLTYARQPVQGGSSAGFAAALQSSHELSRRSSSPLWVKQVACASTASFWARSKSPAGEALHTLFGHLRTVCQTATGIPDASVVRRTTRLPLDYHRSRLLRVYCRTTRKYGGAAKPLVCCDKHHYLSSLFQMKGNSQLQGIERPKALGRTILRKQKSGSVKVARSNWRPDHEAPLTQVGAQASPCDFDLLCANFAGAQFGGQYGFHL
jgi:hypothetical protein